MVKNKGYTVLVVGEGDVTNGLVNNLESDGFKVLVVNSKEDVIQVLNLKEVQMVLVDIKTKEFCSEVLGSIKNNKKFSIIPVMIISDVCTIEDKVEWIASGANDHINKPFEYKELFARMYSHIKSYLYSSQLFKQNEILKENAVFDEATGLFSKKYLMGRMTSEVSKSVRDGEPLSFILVEVEEYDKISQYYGQEAKDYVLRQIVFELRQLLRLSDLIVRYADNQFGLLLPNTDRAGIDYLVSRLWQRLGNIEFKYKNEKIEVFASIGAYTLSSSDFNSFEKKLKNMFVYTENALERAKKKVGNKVEFFE
jgi:diguanylate cyclase (GGDEF)-like protein